jgi:mono/diheme cytochrome c family protein
MMKRVLEWAGIILGSLLGLIVLANLAISVVSASRLNRTYEVAADINLSVSHDPENIAEGKRLYAIMCQSCHGEDLAGQTFSDFMTGRV